MTYRVILVSGFADYKLVSYFKAHRLLRKYLGMLYSLKVRIVFIRVASIPIEQLAAAESEVTATEYLGKTV